MQVINNAAAPTSFGTFDSTENIRTLASNGGVEGDLDAQLTRVNAKFAADGFTGISTQLIAVIRYAVSDPGTPRHDGLCNFSVNIRIRVTATAPGAAAPAIVDVPVTSLHGDFKDGNLQNIDFRGR